MIFVGGGFSSPLTATIHYYTQLIMENFYSNWLGKRVRQINKVKARKFYLEGRKIYLHPSNMSFDNPWQCPMSAQKDSHFCGDNWEYLLHDYAYYNCDNERGRYIHFYIEE